MRTTSILLPVCLAGLIASATSTLLAATYSWDFRNGNFDNLSLVPIGAGAVNLLKPTSDGLRISVPAGHAIRTVGFSPRFRISGDFEIEIDFTLLKRTQPESGYGSGPNIYLSMGSTDDPAASLGRSLRPDGRDVYGVFAARVEDGKRLPKARLFDVPDRTSRTGRLHLKRTKNEITYSIADSREAALRELDTLPVSDADVTLCRVGLAQSDPQSAAEIILHSIRIEATELPQLPSEQSRTAQLYRPRYLPPETPRSYRWLWQSMAALLVASAFITWLWKRRRA
ncbi:DUF1583 domain-containing protein [bacterium]|nr:DUF1583 domain-containing protein [bacterium]